MAGGAVIAPIASGRPQPEALPKTTTYVILLTFVACIGGLLFGYDTGVVSSAMLYLPDNKGMDNLNTVWQELIVSVTPGVAGISALVAGKASDVYGRRKVIIFASAVFAIGAVICGAAPERWTLMVGRILLGVAIGFASMIIPVFIGEGSPSHMRGALITIYQVMITSGFIVANGLAVGFAQIDPENVGWRLMFGFAAIPAVIQFIGFMFLPDTPRYLYKMKREKEAEEVLSKIYGGNREWITYEQEEIQVAIDAETKSHTEFANTSVISRILQTPHVRRTLLFGSSLQMIQQLIGINTILYYTGNIIQSAGVKDKITTILISCGISVVQTLGTFMPLYFIERMGRRKITLISMIAVFISLMLMGGAFLAINKESARIDISNLNGLNGVSSNELMKCRFDNCDLCITSSHCGFCYPAGDQNSGQCLPVDESDKDHSSVGFCSSQHSNSSSGFYHFSHNCSTKFTVLPIIVMVLYLIAFAFGMGPMPWVYNAEIYPLWARSTCVSITTFVNWTFNLIVSLTFLSLGEAITKYGSFFFYGGFAICGFFLFYFFMPETKGLQMEQIEDLFKTRKEKENVERTLHLTIRSAEN